MNWRVNWIQNFHYNINIGSRNTDELGTDCEQRRHKCRYIGKLTTGLSFIPEGVEAPTKDIINNPDLQIYAEDFGSENDVCYVAEVEEKVVGAVWTRIINDYGHVDDETPSLAISLLKEYRNLEIGAALVKQILFALKEQGYKQVSLSVQKANFAVRMYKAEKLNVSRQAITKLETRKGIPDVANLLVLSTENSP